MATKQIAANPWPTMGEDEVYGEDYFDIFVSQSIGRVRLNPNARGSAVGEAFKIIGQSNPADNEHRHSSYEFEIPGVGHFHVDVNLNPESPIQ